LQQNALRYVVQNFEAVNKLGALLREEDSRQDVLVEPVFDAEVALEMIVVKVGELILKVLG
jgi:hypothetical protein